jgi:hypothetical protein
MQALPGEFMADRFLADDPDCPVFGLNLACAWPFPRAVEKQYRALAESLAGLDPGVYVYPLWETHVTIMTFLNFTLAQRPSAERLQELQSYIGPISALLDTEGIPPFALEFQRPVLTAKAAILPISNPTGEIARLRRKTAEAIATQPALQAKLVQEGFNVPGIVHSTILRFQSAPQDPARFTARFNEAAAEAQPFTITIEEIFLTAETKPYMREGAILQRKRLAAK